MECLCQQPDLKSQVPFLDNKIYVLVPLKTVTVLLLLWRFTIPLQIRGRVQPYYHNHWITVCSIVNGKLYVVGGSYLNRNTISNKLFIYDSKYQPMDPRGKPANCPGVLTANFISGILYMVAEFTLKKHWHVLWHMILLDKWTEKAPMPTAREHLASSVVDGKLYVIGGRSNGMSYNVDANEAYDPATDKWITLEPMPSKRGGLASAAVNGSIYVFGGEQPIDTFSNNEKYYTANYKWTIETPMPTARHGLTAASELTIEYL